MTGVLLSFTAMALSIRALNKTLGIFEILSIRNATGLVVLTALALARPQLRLQLTTRQIWLQATRNVLSFFGQFAWALGITLLPFATVFALEFTTPAWVALFAVLILGERMTASRIGVVALGLAGILLITRPGVELIALHKPPGLALGTHARLFKLLRRLRPAILHTYNLAAVEYAAQATAVHGALRAHNRRRPPHVSDST